MTDQHEPIKVNGAAGPAIPHADANRASNGNISPEHAMRHTPRPPCYPKRKKLAAARVECAAGSFQSLCIPIEQLGTEVVRATAIPLETSRTATQPASQLYSGCGRRDARARFGTIAANFADPRDKNRYCTLPLTP